MTKCRGRKDKVVDGGRKREEVTVIGGERIKKWWQERERV